MTLEWRTGTGTTVPGAGLLHGTTNAGGSVVDDRPDVRKPFEEKYKLSPIGECVASGASGKKCQCAKAGNETAVVCENDDGTICTKSKCAEGLKSGAKKGVGKCKCTYPEAAQHMQQVLVFHIHILAMYLQQIPCSYSTHMVFHVSQ